MSWENPLRPTWASEETITYEEGMVDVRQDSVLGDNVVHLSELDDLGLLESLHGEVLSSLLVLTKQHSAEGASAQSNC